MTSRLTSRQVRLRRTVFVAFAVLVVGGAAIGLVATRTTGKPRAAETANRQATTTTTAPPTTTTTSPPTTTTTDPGALPQTMDLPSATTPQFMAQMNALWQGVVQGSVTPALSAFFPRTAYLQLKTGLPSPSADWQERLVVDYGLDLQAAHGLLGADAAQAMLVSVSVPGQYARWIPPGVCANGIGYYEVANARVIYQVDGQQRSFGIASLISWRGVWYVVHLGAILRNSSGGEVDEPAVGPGSSAPSSTC
jgi:hypothetical protein